MLESAAWPWVENSEHIHVSLKNTPVFQVLWMSQMQSRCRPVESILWSDSSALRQLHAWPTYRVGNGWCEESLHGDTSFLLQVWPLVPPVKSSLCEMHTPRKFRTTYSPTILPYAVHALTHMHVYSVHALWVLFQSFEILIGISPASPWKSEKPHQMVSTR